MTTIFGVNGIIVNILVYVFLLISLLRYLLIYNNPSECKFKKILILIFLLWVINFLAYLIKDYHKILENPLNSKLNWYEVVATFFSSLFIFLDINKRRYCTNSTHCKNFKEDL